MPVVRTCTAALESQLTVGDERPELRLVGGQRGGTRDRGRHRSTPSSTAPEGSLIAPQTNATSASSTWLQAVPRSCRTASGKWFTPCTKASAVDPPCVLTGSSPSGHRVAPDSMNGPPSPRPQNPYCSSASGTATVNGSTIIATSTSLAATPASPKRRGAAVTAPPSRSPNAAVVAKKLASSTWIGAPYCTWLSTVTAGCLRSRARSSDVTSTAAAPSFSSEQ